MFVYLVQAWRASPVWVPGPHLLWGTSGHISPRGHLCLWGGLPGQAWATKPGPLLRHVAVPTTGTTFLLESTGRWNWPASPKLAGLWDPPECCTNTGARPQPRPSELEPVGLESGVCVPDAFSSTCDQVNLGMPQEE